jgi:hypothetical protein
LYECVYSYTNVLHFGQDAALAFAKEVHRNVGERNPDFNKLFSGNLHPLSLTSGVSRECGNQSSAPKDDKDGASTRYILFSIYFL